MKLSRFGNKIQQPAAIVDLMEDLGEALNKNPDLIFLGGGNPAWIPEVEERIAGHLQALTEDAASFHKLVGVYQSPQGDETLIHLLAEQFAAQGLPVTEENFAVFNGSQSAFFLLLNIFSGINIDGQQQKILLPLVPEYLGYVDQVLGDNHFQSQRPLIRLTAPNRFKYAVDFANLRIGPDIGAICVSCPTNPSGNVLSEGDLQQLNRLAAAHNIPLIVDTAYGAPFPNLCYGFPASFWNDNVIQVMSLSKLGLPGVRTGIVMARPEVIHLLVKANTIMSLANGNLGPALLTRLMVSGDLALLTQQYLPSFYRRQRDFLVNALDAALAGIPYRLHEPEGAFFVWLWLPGLPLTSQQLYQRLKQKGLLVMAGEAFFFDWAEHWDHARECIRLTYCQPLDVLARAVAILAKEIAEVLG